MRFQGVVVNVADLDRSVAFYREVLGFSVFSQQEQLAALGPAGGDRRQAIILRALGTSPLGGAGHVGLRTFLLEADSADQLEGMAGALESRRLLIGRRDQPEWSAVVGRDPDGVSVVLVLHHDESASTEEGWKVLDDFLYGIGE